MEKCARQPNGPSEMSMFYLSKPLICYLIYSWDFVNIKIRITKQHYG